MRHGPRTTHYASRATPHASFFRQQLLDPPLHLRPSLVPLHVLASGMDVPDYPVTVDEEADAGPIPLAGVQPPLLEGAPIRVDGNREFEAETLRILFHVLDAQLLVRLVMIQSEHF